MNQILKDVIYGKGTPQQLDFMAKIGGMNEEERTLFTLLHERRSDLWIEQEMCIDHKTFLRIEESVRAKLTIAAFHYIDYTMWAEK